jgi:hypothetical protein
MLLRGQVKLLRDAARPDAAGHAGGRSRGFGFVEFSEHSHALAGAGRYVCVCVWGGVGGSAVALLCGRVCCTAQAWLRASSASSCIPPHPCTHHTHTHTHACAHSAAAAEQ